MIVFVRITADVNKDASWLPADGVTGLESELKDLISKSSIRTLRSLTN